jgi:hypothetical protein
MPAPLVGRRVRAQSLSIRVNESPAAWDTAVLEDPADAHGVALRVGM